MAREMTPGETRSFLLEGAAILSGDLDELRRCATAVGGRFSD